MNIIDLLSTYTSLLKINSIVAIGYLDKNRDIIVKKLACYQTGFSEIDSLKRDKREVIAEKIFTELKKEIRQANKQGDVLVKEADIILKNIFNKISQTVDSYDYKKETVKFSF